MRLIIMFIAIALAAGTFYVFVQLGQSRTNGEVPLVRPEVVMKEVPTTNVYVARDFIPIGAPIAPEMLDIREWPQHLVLQDMVTAPADASQPSDILGTVARTPFEKGEPLIRTKLANDKDPNFLAASLPKGMRVVTVAVDTETGLGGFLFPGDRVDVLVTHDVSLGQKVTQESVSSQSGQVAKEEKEIKDPITEVLISNVRVMAVNQKSTARSGEPSVLPTNVSLEVTPSDAQKLRLVENGNGRVSLVLRSLKDKDEQELARPTGLGDLSRLTPPAYFSVLYDSYGKPTYTSADVAEAAEAGVLLGRMSVTVVRGVKVESVEVVRP